MMRRPLTAAAGIAIAAVAAGSAYRYFKASGAASDTVAVSSHALAVQAAFQTGVTSPQQVAALFPTTEKDIEALNAAAKKHALSRLDQFYKTPTIVEGPLTFDSVVLQGDLADSEFDAATSLVHAMKNIGHTKALRDAAQTAAVDMSAFSIENFASNRKVYALYKTFAETAEAKGLEGNKKYVFDLIMRAFKDQGFDLEVAQFERIKALQTELNELSTKFSANIAEDKTEVVTALTNLKGVPAPIIEGLKKKTEDGVEKAILGLDYPTYFGVMRNCEIAATRKAMTIAFNRRGYPANVPVLRRVIALRQELAEILGYASYAHKQLADSMVKGPEQVQAFIDSLIPGLQKKWIAEQELLKADLPSSVELTADGKFNAFDLPYTLEQYKLKHLKVDENGIQEHFLYEDTVKGLFDIYEQFFGISFKRVSGKDSGLWEGAELLEVRDDPAKRTDGSSRLRGFVVMDLFPREGKFTHACCQPIVPSRQLADGSWTSSVALVICNFSPATATRPAMLRHDEATTFFHEFGHAVHHLMSSAILLGLAGTSVKRDFVELPSQMLELWLWEKSIVKRVTKHFKTGEEMPDAMIDAKISAKSAFEGYAALRQLTFASLSLEIYSRPFAKEGAIGVDAPTVTDASSTKTIAEDDLNVKALREAVQRRVTPDIAIQPESEFECNFGHLMGYGAGYYGYMYSEVFAADVFEAIKAQDGLLSSTVGSKYAKELLSVGGTRDPFDGLRAFLGREPNSEAFLKHLGL